MSDPGFGADDPRYAPPEGEAVPAASTGLVVSVAEQLHRRPGVRAATIAVFILLSFGFVFYSGFRAGKGRETAWTGRDAPSGKPLSATGHRVQPAAGETRDLIGNGQHWAILPIKPADGSNALEESKKLATADGRSIDLNLDGEAYAWFAPRAGWVKSGGVLEGAGFFDFQLQATIGGQVDAELRCDFFRDAACTSRWVRKRVAITATPCGFEIESTLPVIYCKPAIKLHGHGRFMIDRLTVTSRASHS